MKEHLKLVTSFSELKEKDLVAVILCDWCGSMHRFTLVKYHTRIGADRAGGPDAEEVSLWEVAPTPPNHKSLGVSPGSVSRRKVYLILPGLEQSDSTSSEKKKTRELVDAEPTQERKKS